MTVQATFLLMVSRSRPQEHIVKFTLSEQYILSNINVDTNLHCLEIYYMNLFEYIVMIELPTGNFLGISEDLDVI